MKALYSRTELNRNPFENGQMQEPLQRYLYKFENERTIIRKLKHHEKDYLFQAMKCLYDCGGGNKYNIYRNFTKNTKSTYSLFNICSHNTILVSLIELVFTIIFE